jgi:haloacetate dehalogenase
VNIAVIVELDGDLRLEVTDSGVGQVVLLLHGWPVTAYHWRHNLAALADAGLRAVAVEPRGLGGSSSGPGSWDKETLAAEVMMLLSALHVDRFAVVGHDWGGTIAYLMAADNRERVTALVVEEELLPGIRAGIPAPGSRHYPTWHGPFNRARGLAEALVPGREDAYYGMFLRQSAGPHPLPDDAEDVYLAAYRHSSLAGLGYYRTAEADAEAVRRRAEKPLQMPVLTIGGEYGMGPGVAECFKQVARRVEHVTIDGAGHYPAEQRPVPVNSSLVAFLRDHAVSES